MARNLGGIPTKLLDHKAIRVVKIVEYVIFLESDGDKELAKEPSKGI